MSKTYNPDRDIDVSKLSGKDLEDYNDFLKRERELKKLSEERKKIKETQKKNNLIKIALIITALIILLIAIL